MNKGFLFGSALILLSVVVLVLSITLSTQSAERNSDLSRLSVFDRIDDEVKATQNGYRELLSYFIKIKVRDNNVTFSETLKDTSGSNFFTFANNFKTFVEQNASFKIKIDLSGITSKLPLKILPAGVLYSHPLDFGSKRIEVTNAQQIVGYNITILLNKTGATPVEWEEGPVSDPQGLRVNISVGGLTGNDFTFSGTLSRTELSEIRVKFPGADLIIQIGNEDVPGRLRITNDNTDITALVNTTITVNSTNLYVAFPDQTINITAGEYNISKLDAVRVA